MKEKRGKTEPVSDFRTKIIEILKKAVKLMTVSDVSRELGVGPSTGLKYVSIMQAEGKLIVEDLGNVKVVKLSEGATK